MDGFAGKAALVTGAAGGIGRAVCVALAERGTRLLLVDRADSGMEALREQIVGSGGVASCRAADVRNLHGAEAAVRETVERYGALDFLVLVAGVSRDGPIWRLTEEDWDFVVDVNLKGWFAYAKAAAPHFRERKAGKIVAVSSINGLRGKFGLTSYASSKAGLLGLIRTLAVELGPSNVNVNAVAPGFIRTPLTASLKPEFAEAARTESALGRIGEPSDVAHVILFLLSEGARHVTGEVLRVDGGQCA
jgi:3-oxoacyl-[acyl-carrier protein] reductase